LGPKHPKTGRFQGLEWEIEKKHEEHLADWWFQPAPLKNMKVNGKDYHSQYMDKIKTVPNHQPVGLLLGDSHGISEKIFALIQLED